MERSSEASTVGAVERPRLFDLICSSHQEPTSSSIFFACLFVLGAFFARIVALEALLGD